jgi:hypothetical protein
LVAINRETPNKAVAEFMAALSANRQDTMIKIILANPAVFRKDNDYFVMDSTAYVVDAAHNKAIVQWVIENSLSKEEKRALSVSLSSSGNTTMRWATNPPPGGVVIPILFKYPGTTPDPSKDYEVIVKVFDLKGPDKPVMIECIETSLKLI